MNNKYTKQQEVVEYPGPKLPVIFCIDVSDSMNACEGGIPTGKKEYKDGVLWNIVEGGHTVMSDLKERVNDFHIAMKEDKKSSITCQTAYITFGTEVNLIEDFGLVKTKESPVDKLIANHDGTFIVEGLEKCLELLDEQKKVLIDNGVKYFQPWLIILTDGKAQDDPKKIKEIKTKLVKRQKNKKLIVYTMALKDDQNLYEQIRGYSIYKPIPFNKNKDELKKFFSFLKQSISSISNSKIKDDLPGYTSKEDSKYLQ